MSEIPPLTPTSKQFLDPNLAGPLPNEARKAFREGVVFSVGSGNYVEYQDLQDYAARYARI
jgi:hypothetical protein